MLMEGEDGNIHLKNLSMHLASNEEEGTYIYVNTMMGALLNFLHCYSSELALCRRHQQNDCRGNL